MDRSDFVWGGLLLAGVAVEAHALRTAQSADTLSGRTRKWFRVDTVTGKIIFTGGWVVFSCWFVDHIVG
jgi:hypothetical protein